MDMSMDGSPIIDKTHIEGLYLNCGWCYGGFKSVHLLDGHLLIQLLKIEFTN